MKLEDRVLLNMLEQPSGCWEWQGPRNGDGYGQTSVAGKQILVHRLSYELWVGPIGRGLHVLHSCDNPPCGNPEHLSTGTNAANVQDAIRKGRRGARRLTEEQVIEMRSRYVLGESQQALASSFSVSQMMVSLIVRRKNWSHVP